MRAIAGVWELGCLRGVTRPSLAMEDKNVYLYAKDGEKRLAKLAGHTKAVTSVAFSPKEIPCYFLPSLRILHLSSFLSCIPPLNDC